MFVLGLMIVAGLAGGFSLLSGPAASPHAVALPSEGALVSLGGSLPLASPGVASSPLPSQATVVGALSFTSQDPQEQSQLLQEIYTPGSSTYHSFLTGNEWDTLFGPSVPQQASLLTYLGAHGIDVTQTSDLQWNLIGPASAFDTAFDTTFVQTTGPSGASGYAPTTTLHLPADLARGVGIDGGFETIQAQFSPADLIHPHLVAPAAPAVQATPHATITLNITASPWIIYGNKVWYDNAPTNANVTYTVSITGGTAPYTVVWHWADGSVQTLTTSSTSVTLNHMYYQPAQADYCYEYACGNMSIWVNDSASNHASLLVGLLIAGSPWTAHMYYSLAPLYALGDTGTGTKIGFGEMCDPSFTSYQSDINTFDTQFGLPATTLDLIGTGATTCSGGDDGWSGETMLDLEWAHTMAPNATLVVDLANSNPDEGDNTWTTTSNGVFVASNSWTCGNANCDSTIWNKAATNGESFLVASGDCGSAGLSGSSPTDLVSAVGVGGTQIYPFPSGTYRLQTAWNGSTDSAGCSNDEGSTGGCVTSITMPWYQTGMTGASVCGTHRGDPDISAIGGTWVEIYDAGWGLSAGTSLACPSSAAMLDLIYQYNGTATSANGFANYDLYNIAKTANYNVGFDDVTIGNNLVSGSGSQTSVGWDPVTGLGSFNVSQLAQLMAVQNGNTAGIATLTAVESANVTFGQADLSVFFGADAAGGPSNLTGYSYAWTFGDSTPVVYTHVPYTEHVYTTAGIYMATVLVQSGTYTGTSNSLTIHVTAGSAPPPTYTVTFATSPTTCSITFNGVSYTNGGSVAIAAGSYSLVANTCTGETFSSWTSTAGTVAAPTSATTTVTVSATGTITATYTATGSTYTVSFATSPTTCTIKFNSVTYTNGGSVAVAAGSYPLVANPCTGETFSSWASTAGTVAGPTSGTTTVTVSATGTITASYTAVATTYTVSFATSPTGCSVTFNGTSYLSGQSASGVTGGTYNIIANACTGENFLDWTSTAGTVAGPTTASTTVDVTGSGTITASYQAAPPTYTITFVTSPSSCTITFNGITYDSGQDATGVTANTYDLAANSCSGETFSSWTSTAGNTGSSTSATTEITVSSTGTVTATYTAAIVSYTVDFAVSPSACATASTTITLGTTAYASGGSATEDAGSYALAAGTCTGYTFSSWGVDPSTAFTVTSASKASTTVTVSAGGTITATFVAVPALSATMWLPSTLTTNTTVSLWVNVTGGEPTYTVSWNFGNTLTAIDTIASGSLSDAEQTSYAAPGTYTVTATITDSAGQSASTQGSITITNQGATSSTSPSLLSSLFSGNNLILLLVLLLVIVAVVGVGLGLSHSRKKYSEELGQGPPNAYEGQGGSYNNWGPPPGQR